MTLTAYPTRARPHPFRSRMGFNRLIPALALLLALGLHFIPPARAADLDAALDATLVVYSDDLDEAFLGSAFLWGDGQIAVTNQHVVGDARTVELRTRDGRRLSARVVARDKGRDIALIAVPEAALGRGLAPSGTVPNWHSVPAHAPPSEAVMLCSVRPVGSCSLTSTKRASLGPAFVMVTV